MDGYVEIKKSQYTGKHSVVLHRENQSFFIGTFPLKSEAAFMHDMLCICLDGIVQDEIAKRAKKPRRAK